MLCYNIVYLTRKYDDKLSNFRETRCDLHGRTGPVRPLSRGETHKIAFPQEFFIVGSNSPDLPISYAGYLQSGTERLG